MNNVRKHYLGKAQYPVHPVSSLLLITHHDRIVVDGLFSKQLIHSLSHQRLSHKRQLLVDTELRNFSTNISGQRKFHVVQSMPDTSSISRVMCGLTSWVTVWQVHVFCHNVIQACILEFPLKWSFMTAGKCAFGSKSVDYARQDSDYFS